LLFRREQQEIRLSPSDEVDTTRNPYRSRRKRRRGPSNSNTAQAEIEKAVAAGFSKRVRQTEATRDAYDASREVEALHSERSALESERDAAKLNFAHLDNAPKERGRPIATASWPAPSMEPSEQGRGAGRRSHARRKHGGRLSRQ
jgi:hypothetical protein